MNVRSIYTRLILGYTILVVSAFIGLGTYTYKSLQAHLYAEIYSTFSRRIEHIRHDVLPLFNDKNIGGLSKQIEQIFSPKESNRFIRISKQGVGVVYLSGMPQDQSFNPSAVPFTPLHLVQDCEQGIASNLTGNILVFGCKTELKRMVYLIEMGVPIGETTRVLHQFVITLIIGLAVVTLLAIVAGGFLVKLSLSPVEEIRASAEKITYGNVSQRLSEINTGDSIEHLSKTLNQMLDRLEQAYQNASRFSSDASHELRTPLAIVRSDLETLQKDKALPFEIHDRLGSILEEIERLSAIVESLLTTARLEAGEAKTKNEVINLAEVTRSSIEQMQLLADEKKISVSIVALSPVFIRGDEARIRQMIVNLFDNAVKYTPQFGNIDISVFVEAGTAVIVLKDSGIGISAEALPHIFERFYRADKVRSSTSQGTGLGLYIVRAICSAHGGVINVESIEGHGTKVEIELPLETSAVSAEHHFKI